MRNIFLFILLAVLTQSAFGQWYWGSKSGRSAAVNLTDRIASSKDITIGIGSDDPTTTPKNDVQGSVYLNSTAAYRKTDDGSSTNWVPFLTASAGGGTDECIARWNGTGVFILQDSVVCITDLGVITGATALTVDNIQIDGNSVTSSSGSIILDAAGGSIGASDDVTITTLTASMPVKTDANKTLVSSLIDLAADVTGLLPVSNLVDGGPDQVLGTNAAGNSNEFKTIQGTVNQVSVTHTPGLITIGSSQDIAVGSSPTFVNQTLSGRTAGRFALFDTGGAFSDSAAFAWSGSVMTVTGQLNVDSIRVDGDVISNQSLTGDVVIQADPSGGGGRARFTNGTSSEYYIGSNNPELPQMMTYPSFEESVSELQCDNCAGFTQETSTGVEGELYGLAHAQATYGGATIDTIFVMPGTNFDDDMNATVSCWINTGRSGVTFRFSNTTDGDSDSQAVSSGSTWAKYSASGICRSGIGEGCGWKIVDNTAEAGAININACTIQLGSVYGASQIGTIDSVTKSANGAVISGSSLFMQTADATNVGLVSSTDQTFGGTKTFADVVLTDPLDMSHGGTNKSLTAVNGGLVWSDADSFEVTSAGTSGQAVLWGGAGAPTGFNPSTKAVVYGGASGVLSFESGFDYTESSDELAVGSVWATSTTRASRPFNLVANTSDITSPEKGNVIFHTGVNKQYNYNGTSWELVTSTADVVTSPGTSNSSPKMCSFSTSHVSDTVTEKTGDCFTSTSMTNVGQGRSTATFKTGFWTDTPICVADSGVVNIYCHANATSSTDLSMIAENDGHAFVDTVCRVICHGQ